MVVRMSVHKVLIITDETKSLERSPKQNTLFDRYSGSFNAVKSFYKKLKENDLDVDFKILLNSNFIVDAFDNMKRESYYSITEFLSNINNYDVLIILLSKERLLFFSSEYRKNKVDFSGEVFIIGPESVRLEINEIFSQKTEKLHFFKRVGVARLNKNYSNAIIQRLLTLKNEKVKNG